jgi:Holliday junction resolvase
VSNTPESKVKVRVKHKLDMMGIYYFMPATGGYGSSGVPDIVCCAWGKFLAIECKAGNNRTTALQDRELKRIHEAGGAALIVNEQNIDELHIILQRIKGTS